MRSHLVVMTCTLSNSSHFFPGVRSISPHVLPGALSSWEPFSGEPKPLCSGETMEHLAQAVSPGLIGVGIACLGGVAHRKRQGNTQKGDAPAPSELASVVGIPTNAQ